MIVKLDIKNLPPVERLKGNFIVARRDDYTAKLWYYGTYETEERAYDVALELENGIVCERS